MHQYSFERVPSLQLLQERERCGRDSRAPVPCRFGHGVVDAEAVAAPVDMSRVGSHPRSIMKAAGAAHCRRAVAPLAHVALQLAVRHRAVIARFDLSIRVELEAPQFRFASAPADRSEPVRARNLVEQVAGQRIGGFWQHGQGGPRRCRRRGAAGELVLIDHFAGPVARMRSVDRELPRPERTEALNQMLRYGGVVWIAAAIPAPRSEPSKGLVYAGDPRLLGAAGVARKAVYEQFRKTAIEGARQGFD